MFFHLFVFIIFTTSSAEVNDDYALKISENQIEKAQTVSWNYWYDRVVFVNAELVSPVGGRQLLEKKKAALTLPGPRKQVPAKRDVIRHRRQYMLIK
jgi:hypothetical protein